jgi:hypothetical protein
VNKSDTAYLVIPSTGTRIPVPDGDDFDPAVIRAEHEALAAHPEVRARAERTRRNRAEGKGIAAAALYRELGYTPPHQRPAKGYNGRLLFRMPASLHQDLAERAAAEGTTLVASARRTLMSRRFRWLPSGQREPSNTAVGRSLGLASLAGACPPRRSEP